MDVEAGSPTVTTCRACYPLQLLVRYDEAREALVYDMFDFKPMTKFEWDYAWAGFTLGTLPAPVSAEEMKRIEHLIRYTRWQRTKVLPTG